MQEQFQTLNERFDINESRLLGKGATGNVFLGLNKANRLPVAIKLVDLTKVDNEVTRYLLACEIAALNALAKHDGHVVKLIETVIKDNKIFLIMELLEGGTLSALMKKASSGLPEAQALHIIEQVLKGYQQIKNKGIVHRDIKPENILFRSAQHNNLAIIDFGYCIAGEVNNKPSCYYNVGSPKYMSPEAYFDCNYSEKSDIWSVGVILYELLVGDSLDKGAEAQDYFSTIERQGISFPSNMKQPLKSLILQMLHQNVEERADCDKILREVSNYIQAQEEESFRSRVALNYSLQFQPVFRQQPSYEPMVEESRNPKNDFYQTRVMQKSNSVKDNSIKDSVDLNALQRHMRLKENVQPYKNFFSDQDIKIDYITEEKKIPIPSTNPYPQFMHNGQSSFNSHMEQGKIIGNNFFRETLPSGIKIEFAQKLQKVSNNLHFFEMSKSMIGSTMIKPTIEVSKPSLVKFLEGQNIGRQNPPMLHFETKTNERKLNISPSRHMFQSVRPNGPNHFTFAQQLPTPVRQINNSNPNPNPFQKMLQLNRPNDNPQREQVYRSNAPISISLNPPIFINSHLVNARVTHHMSQTPAYRFN